MARKRTPTTDPRKAVGYIRVSTDEQQLGPDAQRAALHRWCDQHGAEIVAIHTDQGISGGAPLDKRPALLAAIADLKAHGAGVLLVAKRDRLARDVINAAVTEKMAEKHGAQVLSADNADNGDGPDAWLMKTIKDAFSQYELMMIRARTKAAMAVKKSRGERISYAVPYGFRLAADGRTLEADPHEQRMLDLVRRYRGEGLTLAAIGQRLEAQGLVPRRGGRWHTQTLLRMAAAA